VEWHHADVYELPFADAEFDHVFVCFVLEHLPDPPAALAGLRRVLRPGGTLTVIEGDHGSVFFHPDSAYARAVIDCQVRLQAAAGGNALLGRELQPLLAAAGYADVVVRPLPVSADPTRPALVDGFTRDTFIAMVASVRDGALAAGLTTPADWDRGIADLLRAADDGTFHYTFFKALAVNPPAAAVSS
jgi:SAM-dependent methyltransferase